MVSRSLAESLVPHALGTLSTTREPDMVSLLVASLVVVHVLKRYQDADSLTW